MHSFPVFACLLTGLFVVAATEGADVVSPVSIAPDAVVLDCPEAAQQIVVSRSESPGRTIDVTREVTFAVDPSHIATVDERGLVRPLANGSGKLVVKLADIQQSIPITVEHLDAPAPISFRREIIPILSKAGCNSGGCHGKAEGQNGFKLSIFGFDARADYEALVMEGRGRRISAGQPEASLLFRKGSARIPHGGGRKIEPGSYRDRRLLRWISEGALYDADDDPAAEIVSIDVQPQQQILYAGQSQQLSVRAIDAAGNRRCVTSETEFESNAPGIAEVDSRGLVQASDVPGEAAILVRHLGHLATCRITLPRPDVTFERPAVANFIDELAWDKLQRLGITASGRCNDATFIRRVYLDTIGTLPTVAEASDFLTSVEVDKRRRLIDHLLERDEYVDYWTMKWLDILRADQLKISPQGAVAMQRWLKRLFQENRPFDELARDLLTVQGNTSLEGPGSFYRILSKPDEAARSVSQLLLGVRIECAQCHHHPSERWTQADYVGLAGFFTGLSIKKLPNGEQALVSLGGKELSHPRTGEPVPARALGAAPANFSHTTDRRQILADWVTQPDNPFFAKAIANRLWAHYFGRGLVEPIDDLRETNPPTNPELLAALAAHLHEQRFDLKALTRTLLNSELYQRSGDTLPGNASDRQNYSHFLPKSLPAEVLLDAISQCTGVPEEFNGWPVGYRAIQVWDNRMPSYFFTIFGRPVRATVCECERSSEPSIAQALHLLNAPEIMDRIAHRHGRVRRLAESEKSPADIIDELYLATLSRHPTAAEQQLMRQAFEQSDRRAAGEDVLWALLNSREFVFNH
ncbi:MAG: DUF1553 domain-containing protein [Planctomycetaceae bacterium]